MKILGIETSADDTGIALIDAEGSLGMDFKFKILANAVSSQKVHAAYGGIYPNLAKREHAKNLPIVLEQIERQANERPDAIAVTVGPGLEPCLWEGITFAQELSKKWNVPIVPVNHMEGHILISMMDFSSSVLQKTAIEGKLAEFEFPALALLVSGGHTELILMKEFSVYEYLGRTRDDAVGEAFDKVARLLGLPYPGGPEISRLADAARSARSEADFSLPRPMLNEDNYDFSFAGLKTAVLRLVQSKGPTFLRSDLRIPLRSDLETFNMQVAREFEDAATEVLVEKTIRAAEAYGANTVVVGGGVSANKHIRTELGNRLEAIGTRLLVCPPEHSTDNALMIALAGYFRALKKEFIDPKNLKASGNLKLC